jgi:hypothetical protein
MCTLTCTMQEVRQCFRNIPFKFIHRYILLKNIKQHAFDKGLIADLKLHIHVHKFNWKRFMTANILPMCICYTILKPH